MRRILKVIGIFLVFALPGAQAKEMGAFVVHTTEGEFADVKDNLVSSIVGQGLVLAHESNVAEMLNRTGKDLGIKGSTYKHGTVVEFCSASLSRATVAANPDNILFCPFSIAIYQRADDSKIEIRYLKLSQLVPASDVASVKALKAVEDLLGVIVEDALF